ncbi:MAG: hypothetical protein H6995_14550 [Pseudomonadales bacterium]|nr:hypothetical protein [Pseudomonadales bacterium]
MSLRASINNKCRECIYDKHQPGTWRQQVQGCTSPGCPLYQTRPKTTRKRVNRVTPLINLQGGANSAIMVTK